MNVCEQQMELLNRREAARLLQISPSTLWAIVNGHRPGLPPLPVIRVGRRLLFRRQAVEQWLLEVEARSLCNEDRSKS